MPCQRSPGTTGPSARRRGMALYGPQEPQATAEAGLSHAECADLLRGLKAGE